MKTIPIYTLSVCHMTSGHLQIGVIVTYNAGERDAHGASESFCNYYILPKMTPGQVEKFRVRQVLEKLVATMNRDLKWIGDPDQ